jgi:hypothetical protein
MTMLKIVFASALISVVAAPAFAEKGGATTHPAWSVYDNQGHLAGADPDPLVRQMLRRDPPSAQ